MNTESMDLEAIFHAALEIPDEAARSAFLSDSCGSDEHLRARVERLLAADLLADRFLESPAVPRPSSHDLEPIDHAGAVIGPYELIEVIGIGGMGVVHRASQVAPVRRQVALKLIRPGLDSPQLTARFEAERQALALMDHPRIPRILDAGETSTGRPYFVMELVEGEPITDFCEHLALSIEERLRLFVQVCDAVRHAHHKGIIHRDIKPANILVRMSGDGPIPKVIDFGIAKSTGPALSSTPCRTASAQWFGSPLYMSPEQAALDGTDIDTRSDVYSLGVLLYELLTGTTPFDAASFEERTLDEIRRVILERDPPAPSSRLASNGPRIADVAASRRIEPRRLVRLVRGELDWITMKAMEKDRDRRYDSVGEFADDVARRLADEPVEAGPPSRRYRAGKFMRRHRFAMFIGSLVGLILLTATVVSLRQASWAMKAEAREAVAREAAERSRLLAERSLVAAAVRQAAAAAARRQYERAQELLASAEPAPGEPDHRGFAWSYVRRIARREIRLFRGHQPEGTRISALSPDGSCFATADPRGTVRLWDVGTEQLRATLSAHSVGLIQLVFSADGKRLASVGSRSGRVEIRVWDVDGGRLFMGIDPNPDIFHAQATFASKGDRLAALLVGRDGQDRRLEIFELTGNDSSAAPLKTIPLSSDFKVALENGVLAGVTPTHQVIVFDIANPDRIWTPPRRRVGMVWVVLSRDGRQLVIEDGEDADLFDVATRKELARRRVRLPGHDVETSMPNNDGSKFLIHYKPDRLALSDTHGDAPAIPVKVPIDPHNDHAFRLAEFSPDGTRLAVVTNGSLGSSDGLSIVDVASGEPENVYPGRRGAVSDPQFTPDGRSLLLYGGGYVQRWILDPSDREPPDAVEGHSDEAWAAAVSPDGRIVATGSDDTEESHTIKLRDPETGALLLGWNAGRGTVASLGFSPRGDRLVSSHLTQRDNVRLWNPRTGGLTATLGGHTASVRSAVFSPDGAWLASADDAGIVRIWNGSTGAFVREISAHPGKVRQVVFSPDGRRLLSCGNDDTARLWEVPSGRLIQLLAGASHCSAAAIAPNGETAAVADENGTVTLWNTTSGEVVRRIRADDAPFRTLTFAPDGRSLAASGEGKAIRLWDAATGQDLLELEGHEAQVNSIAFVPDGETLVSCDHSGIVRFWRAREPR
ncbi:MAG: protein kinase [Isosphaeraceae bacterium]|nr:protein kinase [Isosphaeraceae bacterium]